MVVYAAGSMTTALSPNVTVLIVGWSGLEGIGAAMVIPAIASLTARNYSGADRAMAYGIIGGIAAAGSPRRSPGATSSPARLSSSRPSCCRCG